MKNIYMIIPHTSTAGGIDVDGFSGQKESKEAF
jgi:hypothetical protein